jgi:8-oxo-dGTP pyrophosphatase MutT (NUDIX family)
MSEAEAAVAILHARAPEESVLLMRRAERADDSWSGQWSLPGGRRDPGDVDLLHTALRELEEECGIRLRREDVETVMPQRLARRRVGPFLLVAPFVFRVESELATILDPLEAAHAEWVPLSRLRDLGRHRLRPVPGIPPDTLFPAVDLDCAPLWGFTYRLLSDWLGLSPAGDPEAVVERFLEERGLRDGRGEDLMERLGRPGPAVLGINRVEVRPEEIRILGPKFEEYVVHSRPA